MSVSVVMPVFNGRRFVVEQIHSIVTQLEPGDELIVIDDASTDDTVSLIESLGAPCVRIHRSAVNRGTVRSFERGLQLARGQIVFLSDQDDIWLPGKRAAFAREFALDSRVLVVISDAQLIDTTGAVIAPSFMRLKGGFSGGLWSTLWRNRYMGCAMAVRRALLDLALPIPARVPMHDMWLGVLGSLEGRVVFIDRPYVQYRRHEANLTGLRSRAPFAERIAGRLGLLSAVISRAARRRPISRKR